MEGKVIVVDTLVMLRFPKAIKCDQTLILVLWLLVAVSKCLLSPIVPRAARPGQAFHWKIIYYIHAIYSLA